MRRTFFPATGLLLLAFPAPLQAQETIADILAHPALDINRPADRASAVERIPVGKSKKA